jgi:hypothetical protein
MLNTFQGRSNYFRRNSYGYENEKCVLGDGFDAVGTFEMMFVAGRADKLRCAGLAQLVNFRDGL